MSKRYEHIIFDIGNVVLEWQPEHILRSVFTTPDTTNLLKKTFQSREWLAYDQGVITTKELKEQLAHNLKCSILAIEALLQQVVIALRPIPDMIELLTKLKAGGYHLHALTNMPNDIFNALYEKHKFWQLFDDINVSAKLKLIKPDAQIFEFILTKNQIKAENCIFLDDSLANVTAAKELGFTTIKVINYQQAIDDLTDLLAI